MHRYAGIFILFLSLAGCGKKEPNNTAPNIGEYPDWIIQNNLIFPDSQHAGYKDKNIWKTFRPLADVEHYYKNKLTGAGFKELTRLEMSQGVLLQYRKGGDTISVELRPLPYSSNSLISLGYSKVDYSPLEDNAENKKAGPLAE